MPWGAAAALHAVLHRLPDLEQAAVDVGIAAPVAFVGAHDLRNGLLLVLRQLQQLRGAVKGQGQHLGVGRNGLLALSIVGGLFADDKAAAHRVIGLRIDQCMLRVPGLKAHAVGVERQAHCANQQQIGSRVKHDALLAIQQQLLRAVDLGDEGIDGIHIHRVGRMAGQAQDHRTVAGMANAGSAQRAEQLAAQAGHLGQHPLALQALHKGMRRAHRAYRVRAARPDTDLEQIKHADCHGYFPFIFATADWR